MFWLCPFSLLSILYIDMSFLVSRFTVLFQIPTPHQNDYIITISSSNIIMTQMTLLTPICGRLVTLMVTVLHPSLEFCHVILLSTLSLGLAKEYYQKKKNDPSRSVRSICFFLLCPYSFAITMKTCKDYLIEGSDTNLELRGPSRSS